MSFLCCVEACGWKGMVPVVWFPKIWPGVPAVPDAAIQEEFQLQVPMAELSLSTQH